MPPECILGPTVPYLVKSSFGKNSYVVSTALFKGKWCNELHSDKTQDKHCMVQDLNTTHGIRMLEKTWRIFNLIVEVALMSHLYI